MVHRITGLAFWLMLLGALISHGVLRASPLGGKGSAVFLFIGAAYVLSGSGNWRRLVLAGFLGYCSEVWGVHSDFLFGRYVYTTILEPSVFGAPVAMVGAWLLLFGYARQIASSLTEWKFGQLLLASALMVGMDVVIDPLAAHALNFWNWLEPGPYHGIPLRNFLGWFGVTLFICLVDSVVSGGERWLRSGVEVVAGQGVMVMYTVAAWSYGYLVPGVVGLLWLVLEAARTRGEEWKLVIPGMRKIKN